MFVDESGFHTSMTRLRARAPRRGQRAYGKVPRNRGKNQSLIASITLEGGMGESVVIEGTTDAEIFEAYVERFLAPTLEEGRVVVLDGLGAHRTGKVREGQGTHRSHGRRACILAVLLAGPEPHRGSFQQDEGHRAQGGSSHARSAGGGDSRGAIAGNVRRLGGLVQARWLQATGSIFVSTAVGPS